MNEEIGTQVIKKENFITSNFLKVKNWLTTNLNSKKIINKISDRIIVDINKAPFSKQIINNNPTLLKIFLTLLIISSLIFGGALFLSFKAVFLNPHPHSLIEIDDYLQAIFITGIYSLIVAFSLFFIFNEALLAYLNRKSLLTLFEENLLAKEDFNKVKEIIKIGFEKNLLPKSKNICFEDFFNLEKELNTRKEKQENLKSLLDFIDSK